MRAELFSLALAAGACLGASRAAAQGTAAPRPWYRAITVNAFAEASYTYNFNRPDSGLNTLRVFDYDDQELKLDLVEVVVQEPASKRGDFGFRLDATVGQSVPKVAAAYGLFRDLDTGKAHDYDIHQMFVSWVAPLGKGLKIDAGKFITAFGMEVIEGYDGYNDNQTRAEMFDDPDGARTGTAQTLAEATLTPEWKLGKHFVLRGDLRRDQSGADVFEIRAAPASSQTTVTAAVLFTY